MTGDTRTSDAMRLLANVAEDLSKNPARWKHSIDYVTSYRELELIVVTVVPSIMRGLVARLLASTNLAVPSIFLQGGNTIARQWSRLQNLRVLRGLASTIPSST